MLSPLDPAALPKNVTALRTLLLSREQQHAAELEAAREGLKEQVLQNEQLKARLAKLLRQRFGSLSSISLFDGLPITEFDVLPASASRLL
jgi:hypothetical protein